MEIWVEVKGYEGLYMVSNLGNVKSMPRQIIKNNRVTNLKGTSLKVQYNKRVNVYEIHLFKNGNRRCWKVHRLVAENFVHNDDPANKIVVNHIDGNRANNSSSNLEWVTPSENLKHAYDTLKRAVSISTGIKRCKSIDVEGNERFYRSICHASRETNISSTQIRRLLNKECKNKKYSFYYV